MPDLPISELQAAVRNIHACQVAFIDSVPVIETFQGATIWKGIVHVLRLIGHPSSDRCYSWSHDAGLPEGRARVVAFLHEGNVYSPQSAVRAAIIEEMRQRDL
jgi:hypothetical protein